MALLSAAGIATAAAAEVVAVEGFGRVGQPKSAALLAYGGDGQIAEPDGELVRHHPSAFSSDMRTPSCLSTLSSRRSCSVSAPCSSADR